MGDVVIGENANVKAHSVVMPTSRIDDNQTVSPG
jgi:acetyltransferase-like isoleucine patch superfamily enzyme